jgi:tetratricopeptide (TPR) repeat protein
VSSEHQARALALYQAQRLPEAIAAFEQALQHDVVNASLWNNLGVALKAYGQPALAVTALQQAIRLEPEHASAHLNLGNALRELDRTDEAIAAYQQAGSLEGAQADLYSNLGSALYDAGRYAEACAAYQQALQLDPQLAVAHLNYALALLMVGRFEEGFSELEWRRLVAAAPWVFHHLQGPAWKGQPVRGLTLLLYAEQGLGDSIQMLRYAEQLRTQGARLIACVQPELATLVARCSTFAQVVCDAASLAEVRYDLHASLLSLPRLLETRLDTIPARVPYLVADRGRIAALAAELAQARPAEERPPQQQAAELLPPSRAAQLLPPSRAAQLLLKKEKGTRNGLTVGIAWSGNVAYKNNHRRSTQLADWAPLQAVEGVYWFSLQKGPRAQELATAPAGLKFHDLGEVLHTLDDTAAAMQALDLIITVDTSVAHLAGALGRPVWVLLSYAPDWRWLGSGSASPWYPSMRLFRQPRPGNWAAVFDEVAAALDQLAKS